MAYLRNQKCQGRQSGAREASEGESEIRRGGKAGMTRTRRGVEGHASLCGHCLACTVVGNTLGTERLALRLATKEWSPASSTGVTWELMRNAPLPTCSLHICILIRTPVKSMWTAKGHTVKSEKRCSKPSNFCVYGQTLQHSVSDHLKFFSPCT